MAVEEVATAAWKRPVLPAEAFQKLKLLNNFLKTINNDTDTTGRMAWLPVSESVWEFVFKMMSLPTFYSKTKGKRKGPGNSIPKGKKNVLQMGNCNDFWPWALHICCRKCE